jgi:hypothetical protein
MMASGSDTYAGLPILARHFIQLLATTAGDAQEPPLFPLDCDAEALNRTLPGRRNDRELPTRRRRPADPGIFSISTAPVFAAA